MTINYTTLLGLATPVTGTESGTWGDDVNNGLTSYLDIAIAGNLTISTDTNVTLSLTNGSSSGTSISSTTAQYATLLLTGSRTAQRTITAPSSARAYRVINQTTGGYNTVINGSATTGVSIPPGVSALVVWNGTDFQGVSNVVGTLGYVDTNIIASYQASVNTYTQLVLQNTSSGTSASADFIVNNNLSTASTYYGDFGINSSTFSGTGSLSAANATYLTATTGDLALGTTTSNSIHLVINGSATDAMTINTSGAVAFNGQYGTSGQALLSNGSSAVPTWGAAGITFGKAIVAAIIFGF
jgi:hypothetical protein